jgi:ankyrin repeat protein
MLKKDIKIFFKAINDGDLNKISSLIYKDIEYLRVCNFAPPKKDDGQSGLQVAFKSGRFEIARFLIEKGSDVNFIESSSVNEWTAPVLHDCIRATIFNSYTLEKDTTKFDTAFSLLELMLNKKADPNSIDSYGNNCLHRAFMDARQMIATPNLDLTDDILLTQLRRVFKILTNAGADINQSNDKRPKVSAMIANFRMEKYHLV